MFEIILNMNTIGQLIILAIVLILIITIVSMFKVKTKYMSLSYDVLDDTSRKNEIFKFDINNAIVNDFKIARKSGIKEINTPAIIDKNLIASLGKIQIAERFALRASGLMIVLGLVGTFFGLTLSISELVTLLNNTNDVISGDVTTITGGLLSSINGMSVAFVTSLFGITASIIVNILTIIVGISDSKAQYLSVIEEYLDNTLGDKAANLTDVNENGQTALEVAFEILASQLKTSMDEISNSMSYRLTVASGNMKDASDSLEKSMQNFNESIEQFSQNTRDFSEFNHHLKTNIQRMSIAFDDLTETLKETNKS